MTGHPSLVAAAVALLSAGGLAGLHMPDRASAQGAIQQAAVQGRTVTFAIENMTCALCPVTVRKAIAGVAGVSSVAIDFEGKSATVTFDASAVSAAEIAAASTNAGYPAKPGGQHQP